MTQNKYLIGFLICWCVPLLTFAQLKTARIFSDHMVLQRDLDIPIWGTASPRESIKIIFLNRTYQTKADKSGKWELKLDPTPTGGPYTIEIQGKQNNLTLKDILIGDVWVCSGQSNMEWIVQNSNNAVQEIASAKYPQIRLFQVSKLIQSKPLDDLKNGSWLMCSPDHIANFSAVGYFFGRALHQKYNIPIGLISTSWGGTNVETWISGPTVIANAEEYKAAMEELEKGDFAKIAAEKRAKMIAKLGDLPDKALGLVDGKALWAAQDLNTQDWKTMEVPQLWEQAGLEGLDGLVWYRRSIKLTEEQASKGIILNLGKIDDSDITWLNGKKIGETTNAYNKERQYTISPQYLKAGENIIAIRVDDTGGGGGLWSKPEDIYAIAFGSDKKIPLAGTWKYKISKAYISNTSNSPNAYPSLLFNGMINPILHYGIKGAIWYQGESNANRAYRYRDLFPLMIKDWRNHWGQGDFPFLWVQLANFMQATEEPEESHWAELREAQTMTLSLPNTGMASAIDIGEADDIHPRNKQDVGKRLALAAQKVAYGENIVHFGPMYKSMKTEGNQISISFDLFGSDLMVKDKYGYIKGFTIAGNDKKFYWAKAKIEDNVVIVYHEKVKNPVAVRYAWANNPDEANLYNTDGLPANPFRTDDWPGITFGVK